MFKDYYAILELTPPVNNSELKKAYRKQCLKWHPDKNPNRDTHSQMQDVIEAYLYLKDEEARKLYDNEYFSFIKNKTFYESTKKDNEEYSYSVENEVVEKWMANARRQAKSMLDEVIDEFKGATKEAGSSILNYLLYYFIPMLIGYLMFKSCIR